MRFLVSEVLVIESRANGAKRRRRMERVEAAVWMLVDGRGETMARDELLESTMSCKRAK